MIRGYDQPPDTFIRNFRASRLLQRAVITDTFRALTCSICRQLYRSGACTFKQAQNLVRQAVQEMNIEFDGEVVIVRSQRTETRFRVLVYDNQLTLQRL